MQQKFGFLKGMDRDNSPAKHDFNSYYDALNIRVVTDGGLSTGSITNEKGNSLLFKIPEVLGSLYHIKYTGTTACNIRIVTSAGEVTISTVGCTNINDIYILLTTNSTIAADIAAGRYKIYLSSGTIAIHTLRSLISLQISIGDMITMSLESSAVVYPSIIGMGTMRDWLVIFTTYYIGDPNGQIWKCKYNKVTETVDSLNGGFLDPSIHLVYNGNLGFSTNYKIGEVISRYENNLTGKIYFADGINTLKHINILDPNSLALPLSSLEIIPNVSLTQPRITSIVKGGLYTSGKVQYAYQLYNLNGAETTPSPLSSLAHLTTPDDYASTTSNYGGSKAKENTGKAVNIVIDNIDGDFNYLRLIAILYESKEGTPSVNIVAEVPVPQSRTVTIVDTGNSILDVYTSSEFNGFGNALVVPKTIATKFNYLLAANIVEEYFDLDEVLDWDARAYRWDNTSTNFKVDDTVQSNSTIVSPTADCIFKELNYAENYRYNKATGNLGGWGPNVSYEFILTPMVIDNAPDTSAGNVVLTSTKDLAQTWSSILDDTYTDNVSYSSYASPINEQIVGYCRGETYRFGIVVFDSKGRQSFAKWIADIRMPNIGDLDTKTTYLSYYDYRTVVESSLGSSTIALSLGLEFTIANLPDGYTYKIVRAKREDSDKSILGQGILGWVIKDNDVIYTQQYPFYTDNKYSDTAYDLLHPGSGINGGSGTFYNHMITFKSPEVSFLDSIKPINGDVIKLVGDVSTHYKFTIIPYVPTNNFKDINVLKIKGVNPITTPQELSVKDGIKTIQSFNSDLFYTISNDGGSYPLTNTIYRGNKKVPKGGNLAVGLVGGDNYLTSKITASGASGLVIANYTKDTSLARYSGITYYQRVNTIYIGCGNSHKTNDFSSTTSKSKVYGGDTYISYFDYLDKTVNPNMGDGINAAWADTYIMYIPLESSINCELREDTCFSRGGNSHKLCETVANGVIAFPVGSDWGTYLSTYTDLYKYNSAYSAAPLVKTFTPKPLYFINRRENDYRVITSEKHTNGQVVDNWTKFLFGNYIEVNSAYGPVNKLISHANNIMFFQDEAYGLLSINERQLVKDDSGASLVLGTGGVLDAFRYISEKSGCKSKGSVIDTGESLFFYDLNNRKFMQYSGGRDQQLSDIKGLSSYFRNFDYGEALTVDQTIQGKGLHGVYDPINNRILFSILGKSKATISYNILMGAFESFYSFNPTIYQALDGEILSIDKTKSDSVYIHTKNIRGSFYGTVYPSYVTILSNGIPDTKKVFTNLEFNSYLYNSTQEFPEKTLTSIKLWNSHQDTGVIQLIDRDNIRRRFRTWRFTIPRVYGERLVDYHTFIQLQYDNISSTPTTFRLDDITVFALVPII